MNIFIIIFRLRSDKRIQVNIQKSIIYLLISVEKFTVFLRRTYKAWHYGLYINNRRNIIIDSCTVSDSFVGIFPFVIGPSREYRLFNEKHCSSIEFF